MKTFTSMGVIDIPSLIPIDFAKFMGLYLFWSLLHIGASNFYTKYCAKWSLMGWVTSGFKSITPECYYAQWVQNATSNCFGTWWFTCGTWFVTKFYWISGKFTGSHSK